MRHDAGIAASPPVRCILGVEWRGHTLLSLVRHGQGIHGSIRGHAASLRSAERLAPPDSRDHQHRFGGRVRSADEAARFGDIAGTPAWTPPPFSLRFL